MYLQSLVLLLCALYGSVFVFGKLILESAPPLFVTASRMILAALLLLLYQFIVDRKRFTLQKEHMGPVLIIGITGVYLTNAFEFWGLQYMEAGKACFLYSFAPIATAVMSYLWFSEKITLQKWMGLIIGIIGFIPLLLARGSIEDNTATFLYLSFAEWAIITAAITSSIGWLAMREVVKNRHYSSIMANATSMLFGGLLSLLHSWMIDPWDPTPISDFWPFLQWLLCLTLISNLICYNLHAELLRHFSATYLSFVGLSQPLFAALLGFCFLAETLSKAFWLSVTTVSFGLYLYYKDELKQRAPKKSPSQ